MLTIHDNGLKIDDGKFRYAWYKVSESTPQGHEGGTPYYRCVALKQMDIIPVTERQDYDLLGKMWRAMRGIYNANVNFVAANAGIFSPEHIGLVQYLGRPGRKHSRRDIPARHGHRRRGHGELPPIPARPPQRGLAALVPGFHHLARPLHRRDPRTSGPA